MSEKSISRRIKTPMIKNKKTPIQNMGFKKLNMSQNRISTCLFFRICASPSQLIKAFGKPHYEWNGKDIIDDTMMEWGFIDPNTKLVFTVYDYKNPPKSKSQPHNFSVGGPIGRGRNPDIQMAKNTERIKEVLKKLGLYN